METFNVTLNINEAQVLIQLIDIAVKARGLDAAEAGVVLSRKIQQSIPQELLENLSSSGSAGANGSSGPSSGPVTGP